MKFDEDALAAAARLGMEEAGFTKVTAHHFPGTTGLVIEFSGACPCGLGTSTGQVEVLHGDGPTYVRNFVNASARAHIVLDKKEGRWR